MNYKFFLSYARFEVNYHLRKFYEDLVKEVGRITGQWEEGGFLDTRALEVGSWWEVELAKALQTTRVFIYLCSPTYVRREWCGKEWQCFWTRLSAYWKEHPELRSPPSLMIPILWVPTPDLPAVISREQLYHEDFGEFYKENGLYQLMKRRPRHYPTVLNKIARAIAQSAEEHPLPAWPFAGQLEQVHNPFVAPTRAGPSAAQFVYVVGPRNEVGKCREGLDAYGDDPVQTWKPYYPPASDLAATVAWRAVAREKFDYEELPLDESLLERILGARQKNKIVVLLVDAWTLQLPRYQKLMDDYRKLTGTDALADPSEPNRRRNCVVVVPWNHQDPETRRHSDRLLKTLRSTLGDGAAATADSPEELYAAVVRQLIQVRKSLLETGPVLRPVPAGEARAIPSLPSIYRYQGA
jgi:FxsC-like protein